MQVLFGRGKETILRPSSVGKEAAEVELNSGDPRRVAEVIIGLALNEPDGSWVEEQALRLIQHSDAGVRGAAAASLGHLARIHRNVSLPRVLPALRKLALDPETAGRAADALDDVDTFMKP